MTKTPSTRLAAAEREIAAARAASGWPADGTPYANLIGQELTARRLTCMGSLPGLLLDMDSVDAFNRSAGVPEDEMARRNRLHIARIEAAAARLADPEDRPAFTALISTSALMRTHRVAPHRVGPQLEQLLGAMDAGWEIRYVGAGHIRKHLPPDTYDMIISGDPETPDTMYWENAGTTEPHELWGADAESLAGAGDIYRALSEAAFDPAATRSTIEQQLRIV